MKKEYVVLVDSSDRERGIMEKLQAHLSSELHRAVSVMIFNSKGEVLLQKRAAGKYHSAGRWSNASCTHPQPNEKPGDAAKRRLREEMGLDCQLTKQFEFIYRVTLDNGLTEHEYDHVYAGVCDDKPAINPNEVSDWKYISLVDLKRGLNENPHQFSAWLRFIAERFDEESVRKL